MASGTGGGSGRGLGALGTDFLAATLATVFEVLGVLGELRTLGEHAAARLFLGDVRLGDRGALRLAHIPMHLALLDMGEGRPASHRSHGALLTVG